MFGLCVRTVFLDQACFVHGWAMALSSQGGQFNSFVCFLRVPELGAYFGRISWDVWDGIDCVFDVLLCSSHIRFVWFVLFLVP